MKKKKIVLVSPTVNSGEKDAFISTYCRQGQQTELLGHYHCDPCPVHSMGIVCRYPESG